MKTGRHLIWLPIYVYPERFFALLNRKPIKSEFKPPFWENPPQDKKNETDKATPNQ